MEAEDRWPDYAPGAAAAGIGSVLSVPLPMQESVTGALNLYSTTTHAFDDESMEVARGFAGYAAVANAQLYATTATLARQMQEAMESRAVIEQAKGVITGQNRCSEQEAFDRLVRASQSRNRKLRDIAAAVVQGVHDGPRR